MTTSQLWHEYKSSHDLNLKKEIILNYVKLVHYVIHNSKIANFDILDERDYFQFGIEGLNEAVDRFDPDYGTKFETYAILRIRGKIIDELRKLQKKKVIINSINQPEETYINNVSLDQSMDDEENFTLSDTIEGDYDSPEEEVEKNETIDILKETITKLPERDRLILSLYYYENLNYQEIAQILSITVSRVSQVHSRIMKNLKEQLAYINA